MFCQGSAEFFALVISATGRIGKASGLQMSYTADSKTEVLARASGHHIPSVVGHAVGVAAAVDWEEGVMARRLETPKSARASGHHMPRGVVVGVASLVAAAGGGGWSDEAPPDTVSG